MGDKDDRDAPHEARPLGEWGPSGRYRNGGDFDNGRADEQWAAMHDRTRDDRNSIGSVPPEALEHPPYPQGGIGSLWSLPRYVPPVDDPGYAPPRRLDAPSIIGTRMEREVAASALRVLASFRRDPHAPRWQEQTIIGSLDNQYVLTVRIQNLAKLELLPDPPRPAGDAMRSDDV